MGNAQAKGFRIPKNYWSVVSTFIVILFVFTGLFAYLLAKLLFEWRIASLARDGFVLFPYFDFAAILLATGFLSLVIVGLPLSFAFEKLFPIVARAEKLQLEVRAHKNPKLRGRGGFFFLWDALWKAISPSLSPRTMFWKYKTAYEEYAYDEGIKSGDKFSEEEVEAAERTIPLTQLLGKIMFAAFAIICPIWIFMFLNSYLLVSKDEIVLNRFLEFNERRIEWKDVSSVTFDLKKYSSSYSPKLLLHTVSGEEVPVWVSLNSPTPPLENIKELVLMASENGITLETGNVSYDAKIVKDSKARSVIDYISKL